MISAPGALHDLASLPKGAIPFLHCVQSVVVPACLEALPVAIAAGAAVTTPVAVRTAEVTSTAVMRASRLQSRLLEHCSAILGDPLVPLAIEDLLAAYSTAASTGAPSSRNSATALGALAAILDRRGSSARSVAFLAMQVIRRESTDEIASPDIGAQDDDSGDGSLPDSPLRLLVGRLARPQLVELTNLYLSTTSERDASSHTSSGQLSHGFLGPEEVSAVLFCIGASFALGPAPPGECPLFDACEGILGEALLRRCLVQIDGLARGHERENETYGDRNLCAFSALDAPKVQMALRLIELLNVAIPLSALTTTTSSLLKKSGEHICHACFLGCAIVHILECLLQQRYFRPLRAAPVGF